MYASVKKVVFYKSNLLTVLHECLKSNLKTTSDMVAHVSVSKVELGLHELVYANSIEWNSNHLIPTNCSVFLV